MNRSLGNDFAAIFESSQRDARAIMHGVNVNVPSLDAARVVGDGIRHAENLRRAKAQDVAAARKAVDAIKAIAAIDFTPAVAAQITAVLSSRVAASSWGTEMLLAMLDDTADALEAA